MSKTNKIVHSFIDAKGHKWTACCECNRGGNGNDKDKCCCGFKVKKWNRAGCYLGVEISKAPV